jgi:hypothetical protein
MGGRYVITGTQLGMLKVLEGKQKNNLLKDIADKQFLTDSDNSIQHDLKKLRGDKIGKEKD